MLIFDIGANHGKFSEANLHRADKIIAVEANPALARELNRNYYYDNRVEVLNYAASFNCEPLTFYISNADTISTASVEWIKQSRFTGQYSWSPITVSSITLDALIQKYGIPDLLKIDVEGYEFEVAKGLSQKVPLLCFEWAEESLEKILLTIQHLRSIGFIEFGYIFCDDYSEEPTNWGTWESLKFEEMAQPERKDKWGMIFAR